MHFNGRVAYMHWDWTHLCSTAYDDTAHLIAQVLSAFTLPSAWSSMAHPLWFDFSLFSYLFLLSVTVFLFLPELFAELHCTTVMANLRSSAAEESEDTLNAFISPTGYEPNLLTFGELNDSSVPFFFMIPSRTRTWMTWHSARCSQRHTEDKSTTVYQEACQSVSQSSSVMFDQGNLMEWEWSIDQGNLMSVTARTHRLGLYLKSKDRRLSRNIVKKSVITNSMQLTQKKSADSYKDNYGDRKLEFREAHQQSLTEMDELRKFQSSTFDTIARRKLIEDQNTTLALSGRVQEFQNEVNCINDSEDFQDAESVRSGNSHVTSRPVSFPPHPIPEEMLRHSFVSPSRKEGPPSIWDTHGFPETFLQIHMHNHQLLILKNCINGIRQSKGRSIHPQWRKVKGKNKIKIWDASQDRQPKIQSSSVAETLQRIMEQTNNDCRFWIFTLTSSLHQQPLLAGR